MVVEREVMAFTCRERVSARYIAARLSREITKLAARRARGAEDDEYKGIGHGVDGERDGQQVGKSDTIV